MEIKPSFFFFKQNHIPLYGFQRKKLVYEKLSSQKRLKFHTQNAPNCRRIVNREEELYQLVQRPFLSIVNNASHGKSHVISTTT